MTNEERALLLKTICERLPLSSMTEEEAQEIRDRLNNANVTLKPLPTMERNEIAEWLENYYTENPCDDTMDILVAFEKFLTDKPTSSPMKVFSVELFNYALPYVRETVEVRASTREIAEQIASKSYEGFGVFDSKEI